MAQISLPIQVNLPDNWIDLVIERIKQDGTVMPVVHGKWIRLDMHRGMEKYKCSACGQECYVPEVMGEPMFRFCPNCGARMDLEDTE